MLFAVLVLILPGCAKKTDAFTPVEVQVDDWLSSYYPSGALITDAQQAREWYQMALNMEVEEKIPKGYSYWLVFRDADGKEIQFSIASNGVGYFPDIQKEQLIPDWYSGGEALYQAADAAVKTAWNPAIPEVPESQEIAWCVRAVLAAQYPKYAQAEFRAVSHVLLAQTEAEGSPADSSRVCVLYQFADYVREGNTLLPTQSRRDIVVMDMAPTADGTLQCTAFYDAKALSDDPSIAEPFQDVIQGSQELYHTLAENCLAQAEAYARKQGENVEVGYLQPQYG